MFSTRHASLLVTLCLTTMIAYCALSTPRELARASSPFTSGDVRSAVESLRAEEWTEREAAQRTLVALRSSWIGECPEDWAPTDPEAAWRWRWVVERVATLATLETVIESEADGAAWRLKRLHSELGEAVLDELQRVLEHSNRARVRRRIIEQLEALDPRSATTRSAAAGADPSPWVRRAFYGLVARRTPDALEGVLRQALDKESEDALWVEAARAVGVHRVRSLEGRLRDRWASAPIPVRRAICAALAKQPEAIDREYLLWGAESLHYPLAIESLRALEIVATPADARRLVENGIGAGLFDVEARLLAVCDRRGDATIVPSLVARSKSADSERVFLHRERVLALVERWGDQQQVASLKRLEARNPSNP